MKIKTIDGWKVWVNSEGTFLADKEEQEQIQEKTLEAVKQEIERLRKSSAKRLPFWEINTGFGGNTNKKIEGEITSIKRKEGSRYGDSYDIWYSRKREEGRNDRGKWWRTPDKLVKPTDSNEKIMNEYIELKKRKEAVELEMQKKEKEFEMYSQKEIIENFGFEYSKD